MQVPARGNWLSIHPIDRPTVHPSICLSMTISPPKPLAELYTPYGKGVQEQYYFSKLKLLHHFPTW